MVLDLAMGTRDWGLGTGEILLPMPNAQCSMPNAQFPNYARCNSKSDFLEPL